MATPTTKTIIPPHARIVIVEDNDAVIQWISEKISDFENLKLAGSFGSCNGAVEFIKNENPELVILDLKLPDGNGLEILKEIRKSKMHTTVMILTLDSPARNICLRVGADYFFDKSKDTLKFLEHLKSLNRSTDPYSAKSASRK